MAAAFTPRDPNTNIFPIGLAPHYGQDITSLKHRSHLVDNLDPEIRTVNTGVGGERRQNLNEIQDDFKGPKSGFLEEESDGDDPFAACKTSRTTQEEDRSYDIIYDDNNGVYDDFNAYSNPSFNGGAFDIPTSHRGGDGGGDSGSRHDEMELALNEAS